MSCYKYLHLHLHSSKTVGTIGTSPNDIQKLCVFVMNLSEIYIYSPLSDIILK